MSKDQTAIAEATNSVDNLSVEELIAQRVQQLSPPEESQPEPPEETEETEEAEAEEVEETEETHESEEEPGEETEGEEATDIDLESLTPEQIQAIAKKGKSRLLSDIGKLRAEKRALEQKLASQAEAKPLPRPIPAEENPFRALTSMEEIQAKFAELEKVAEDTDRILEDHEDYGSDDVIRLGDKEFTKKEIRTANRNARNAMAKFLPAQAQAIQQIAELKAMEEQFNAAIPVEIPEAADEESPIGKQYKAMRDDPLIEKVRQHIPEIVPQLNFLLAHAARSLISQNAKPKTPVAAVTTKAKVPSTPFGAAGPRSKAPAVRKEVEQAKARYEKTGSQADWQAYRLAQMQNT